MTPRIEVRDIHKHFAGVHALAGVDFSVAPGEIHALLGENGAGKSTLSKIIAGVYAADRGEIFLDGQAVEDLTEAKAGRLGIGIVHQEGSLVDQLSVSENIFSGRQPTGFLGQIDRRKLRQWSSDLLGQLGLDVDPDARVADLPTALRQVVEIAKALSHRPKLLILDEPTAALTLNETAALFSVVRKLAAQGVAVVYVSHRLAEIFELCNKVTVLKDGYLVGTFAVADTDTDRLIRLMVGRELHFARAPAARSPGEVLIEARSVASGPAVRDASVTVRRGEIVCLAGLVGCGRTELCEVLFGARRREAGSIVFKGRQFSPTSPARAIASGIGMVCEDRKQGGLFLDRDIAENVAVTVLDGVSNGPLVSRQKMDALAQNYVRALDIAAPSVRTQVSNLSGGNQQKVLLAKWLAVEPDLLIVDEPTRGVDVGARSEIYRLLRELAAKGVGLLVVSSDLPEVLALADRIVVMADGCTVGEMAGDEADEVGILRLATRGSRIGTEIMEPAR